MNISKLVAKGKKGNNRAFQELIDTEKTKLYKMAYLYMKNEDDALEVFQETVYKALASLKDLKNDTYFSTWITRILINTAIDQLRRKKRVIPMERDFLENKANPSKYEIVMDIKPTEDLPEEFDMKVIIDAVPFAKRMKGNLFMQEFEATKTKDVKFKATKFPKPVMFDPFEITLP